MFGWLWSLYKVTDEQVLEHAGLDAFVVCLKSFFFFSSLSRLDGGLILYI